LARDQLEKVKVAWGIIAGDAKTVKKTIPADELITQVVD